MSNTPSVGGIEGWSLELTLANTSTVSRYAVYSIFQDTSHHKGGKPESYYRGQAGPSIGLRRVEVIGVVPSPNGRVRCSTP